MTLSKTISTRSLASALVAAAVALSPSHVAAGGFKSQTGSSAKVGGPGNQVKPKPKPAHPPIRACKASDHCRD